jgi:hypothetical protein
MSATTKSLGEQGEGGFVAELRVAGPGALARVAEECLAQ